MYMFMHLWWLMNRKEQVPGPEGFYLPHSETKDGPVEFHLGVIWAQKSDFLQKSGVPFTISEDMRFSALSDIVKGTPNFRKKSLFGVQKTPKWNSTGPSIVSL